MPGWAKALIIVAILIVLLVLGVVGGGVFLWMRNKDALMARAKEVVAEGTEFGKGSDNQGCLDETVRRYKEDPGLSSAISTSIFVRTCLQASRPTPGFCADVPKVNEFMKTAQWRVAQCEKVNLARDHYCQQLFQPVQEYCDRRARSSDNTNSP